MTAARVPPHNPEAEAGAIGAAFRSRDALSALLELDPTDFYVPIHGLIAAAIRRVYAAALPVNAVTVADELAGHTGLDEAGRQVREVEAQGSSTHYRGYVAIVKRDAVARRALAALHDASRDLYGSTDPDVVLQTLAAQIAVAGAAGSSLEESDLVAALNAPDDADLPSILRRTDGQPVLYRRKVNQVHAEPGQGKTWLLTAAAAEVVRDGGSVGVVDLESTARIWAGRLLALGLGSCDLGRVRYFNPTGTIGLGEVAALVDAARELDLVLWDSVSVALARDGIEENDNGRVVAWWERVLRPIAAVGPAVFVSDHVTKNVVDRARGARGAGSKLAVIDGTCMELRSDQAFSRERAGHGRLVIAKDRDGHVGAVHETVADVHFRPDAGRMTIELRPPESSVDEAGQFRPSVLMERLSHALDARGEPVTREEALALCAGKNEWKQRALRSLIDEGYVTVETAGRRKLHTSARLFTNDPVPRPDPNPTPTPGSASERPRTPTPPYTDTGVGVGVPMALPDANTEPADATPTPSENGQRERARIAAAEAANP